MPEWAVSYLSGEGLEFHMSVEDSDPERAATLFHDLWEAVIPHSNFHHSSVIVHSDNGEERTYHA